MLDIQSFTKILTSVHFIVFRYIATVNFVVLSKGSFGEGKMAKRDFR